MNIYLVLLLSVGLLIVLAVAALALRRVGPQVPESAKTGLAEYRAQPSLLTPAERSFFGVAEKALPSDCRLFAKVRIADILQPVSNGSRSARQAALNRISAKHVDFLLCDGTTLKILAGIELDDKSHSTLDRGIRDSFLDSAFAQAGIPLVRVRASQGYSISELRQQIENALSIQTSTG